MEPAEIAGIASGVTAFIGAVATFIYKVRGRSWREIFKSIAKGQSEEFKELVKVAKVQTDVLKKVIDKELSKESKKK